MRTEFEVLLSAIQGMMISLGLSRLGIEEAGLITLRFLHSNNLTS